MDGSNERALLNQGKHYFQIKNYEEASKAFQKLIENNNDSHIGWNALGVSLAYLDRWLDSKNCFERAKQLSNDCAIYQKNLDLINKRINNYPPEKFGCIQKIQIMQKWTHVEILDDIAPICLIREIIDIFTNNKYYTFAIKGVFVGLKIYERNFGHKELPFIARDFDVENKKSIIEINFGDLNNYPISYENNKLYRHIKLEIEYVSTDKNEYETYRTPIPKLFHLKKQQSERNEEDPGIGIMALAIDNDVSEPEFILKLPKGISSASSEYPIKVIGQLKQGEKKIYKFSLGHKKRDDDQQVYHCLINQEQYDQYSQPHSSKIVLIPFRYSNYLIYFTYFIIMTLSLSIFSALSTLVILISNYFQKINIPPDILISQSNNIINLNNSAQWIDFFQYANSAKLSFDTSTLVMLLSIITLYIPFRRSGYKFPYRDQHILWIVFSGFFNGISIVIISLTKIFGDRNIYVAIGGIIIIFFGLLVLYQKSKSSSSH